MNATIVIDRSSVTHPLPVALRGVGASDCVLTATAFASAPLPPLSLAPCTPLRHVFQLLHGVLDAARQRNGLRADVGQASIFPRFPHSG